MLFYARWYPALLVPRPFKVQRSKFKVERARNRHVRFIERRSRKLARSLFHAMLRYGPKLEREQLVLGRLVDIGCKLFAMSTACARATALGGAAANTLATVFCAEAQVRIDALFRSREENADKATRSLARKFLEGELDSVLGAPMSARDHIASRMKTSQQKAA
jgi:hypothetical protein